MPVARARVMPSEKSIANWAIQPLRRTSKFGGNSVAPVTTDIDIVDETLDLFKANIFFKSFEIESNEDRVQIYLTLYIVDCLKKLQKCPTQESGSTELTTYAMRPFSLPGEAGFPLNVFYPKPQKNEIDDLRNYITLLRHEVGERLVHRVYDSKIAKNGEPSKWWLCFAKRKFLDKTLEKAY